jgi:hypothetical protein
LTEPDASRTPLRIRVRGWAVPLLLGALCLLVYNANLRTIGSGDTLPARYLPLILWHDGTFALDSNARLVAHGHPMAEPSGTPGQAPYYNPAVYWMVRTHAGQLASPYPVVAPLLAAPLYLPAVWWLNSVGWHQPNIDRAAEIMEKVSASLLAAIASVLMFLVLRRERNRWAIPLTVAFAFATDTWVISSQALWQHGSGELLIVLALLLALGRGSPLRTATLGFVCVLIAANRPPDALIAAAFVIYAFWRQKREALWLLAGAAAPLAALLYYNVDFIGNVVGGYALMPSGDRNSLHVRLLGLPGLLVSPTRGLLVFSPFFIFLPVGVSRRLRSPSSKSLAVLLTVALVAQFLLYASGDWRAGESWGPRWLADLLPIMIWMLAAAPQGLRPRVRGLLVALIAAGVAIQAIGAFWYSHTSDQRIFAGNPNSLNAAWDPSNTPFISELGHGPSVGDLLCNGHGYIDLPAPVRRHGASVIVLKQGAPIAGWALACGRAPAEVLLLLDGREVGATAQFIRRPDVDRAMHTSSASGYNVLANLTGVTPGRHILQLGVGVSPRSDIRIVREEVVLVAPPPSLRALAGVAARRLRTDQQRPGYWLTTFTSKTQYAAPQIEMDTYLQSIIVDLLSPIARRTGLTHAVTRARRFLASQIESNGLVRFHGLPNAPTIGTLGCIITPDSDDTSLAWRIAGKGLSDPRARPMLRTLARYRDARGLYLTWLAPRAKFECLNPGRDPDPADIGIQMHVYLMLRKLDPPAARRLCEAIQRWSSSNDVWVYYAVAPLVPYLRSAELERLGCPVPLPTARLARAFPAQQLWSQVARWLVRTAAARPDPKALQAIHDLLVQLSGDDFYLLRHDPPLLYNNDLTASVKRFYFSEDAGYALWLWLYETMLAAR